MTTERTYADTIEDLLKIEQERLDREARERQRIEDERMEKERLDLLEK